MLQQEPDLTKNISAVVGLATAPDINILRLGSYCRLPDHDLNPFTRLGGENYRSRAQVEMVSFHRGDTLIGRTLMPYVTRCLLSIAGFTSCSFAITYRERMLLANCASRPFALSDSVAGSEVSNTFTEAESICEI